METNQVKRIKNESDFRRSTRLLIDLWDRVDCKNVLFSCSECIFSKRCAIMYIIYVNNKNNRLKK